MAELIIFSGKLKGRRLILPDQREIIVGRDEDCHMRIASSLVSRKHCVLKSTPEGVVVRDLHSQNGTYVNDVAITEPFVMKSGDVLRVGAALFQLPKVRVVPARPSNEVKEQLSDDEITSWLADQEQTISPSDPDTTVIRGRQAAAVGGVENAILATEAPAVSAPPPAAPPPRHPQPPRSIKEQAAEIIRRHWEMMRGKKP